MSTRIVEGERVGKQGRIRTGCSAVIFNFDRQKILLTRRSDNQLWCLPGGGMEPGESIAETCAREVFEEIGLRGHVTRLIGVYTSPHWLVEYSDGKRVQIVAFCFEFELESSSIQPNHEVSEYGYFTLAEIEHLALMTNHHQRILDAFENQTAAFIR